MAILCTPYCVEMSREALVDMTPRSLSTNGSFELPHRLEETGQEPRQRAQKGWRRERLPSHGWGGAAARATMGTVPPPRSQSGPCVDQ